MIAIIAASLVIGYGDMRLRLDDTPCRMPVAVENIDPETLQLFRSGAIVYQGRMIRMCWAQSADSLFVIDEDGDSGQIPKAALKAVPTV